MQNKKEALLEKKVYLELNIKFYKKSVESQKKYIKAMQKQLIKTNAELIKIQQTN